MRVWARFKKLSLWVVGTIMVLFVGLGGVVYCLDKVLNGQGLDPFKLGNVPVPALLGAGASYLDVLILDIALTLAFLVALGFRWYYYRDERDFRRKYKIKGKGSFGRDLIDDLSDSEKP